MTKQYDVILIGSGSVGVPTAMALGALGVKTCVIDKMASPGQGENKHAIGGIRATHSDPGKIIACMRSIEIFSTWQQSHGKDIEWLQGGYLFPVYRQEEEDLLKGFLPIQKKHGLNIDYVDADTVAVVAPGINRQGLLGGIFSPDDGSASPLITGSAFFHRAVATGNVDFYFNEIVMEIHRERDQVCGVTTNKGRCNAPVIIDCAGPFSRELGALVGQDIPVFPDCHEGGVSEPVEPFFKAMLVDLRPAPGSRNYYFYQNAHGHIIFCITPDPPIVGTDKRETSRFLPQVAARMVDLLPRLKNIRVRRVWRGLYPMTPDGSPILGWNKEVWGLLHATGMCGQGYMLGPGLGEIIARMVTKDVTPKDTVVIDEFSLYRDFGGEEGLK
ncbi:MAG: FAD-binding oxidoreductase [Desulfobacterium sp.]